MVDYETLSGDEIQALLKGKKIRQDEKKPAIPPRKTVPDTGLVKTDEKPLPQKKGSPKQKSAKAK